MIRNSYPEPRRRHVVRLAFKPTADSTSIQHLSHQLSPLNDPESLPQLTQSLLYSIVHYLAVAIPDDQGCHMVILG